MMSLIQALGSFIQWIYFNVATVVSTVGSIIAWCFDKITYLRSIIIVVCPDEIGLIILPILVSMFTFLGIKLLVRLL